MKSPTLNFGTLGRCACNSLGRRRAPFAGEPICTKCMPMRAGFVRTIHDVISAELSVGLLTREQRIARRAFLRADKQALVTAAAEGQLGYANDTVQPESRQTRRAKGL